MSTALSPNPQSASSIPLFGRSWKVVVTLQDGTEITLTSDAWEPEALRATFDIEFTNFQFAYADMSIYNCNAETQQTLIKQYDTLSIYAGYQATANQQNQLLFKGEIFQPSWDRRNVVDFRLGLRAMIGLKQLGYNFNNFAMGPNSSQADVVAKIAQECSAAVGQVDNDTLNKVRSVRGQIVYGRPMDILTKIAQANNLYFWVDENGINIRSLSSQGQAGPVNELGESDAEQASIIYSPPLTGGSSAAADSSISYSLLGTPQQTPEGVSFTVLMDGRIKIGTVIQLKNTAIITQALTPGQGYPPILSADGRYIVRSFHHEGDTRGNPWYTHVDALTLNFWQAWSAAQGQPQ